MRLRTGESGDVRRGRIECWAEERTDCVVFGKVEPYEYCRVAGIVERLRIDPLNGTVEATISDGRSRIAARWHLSAPVEQLRAPPGMGLVLEGVPRFDASGEVIFEEPYFEIVQGPRPD